MLYIFLRCSYRYHYFLCIGKKGGESLGIVGERLDERIQFFLKVTENPTVVVNAKGDIYEINKSFATFFEVDQSNNIKETIDQRSLEDFEETLKQLILGESVTRHLFMKVRHKSICAVKTTIHYDEKTSLMIITFSLPVKSCINQTRDYLGALEQTDTHLEVGQLAASVAHEIRNPVTTLKGFTQLLKVTADKDTMRYLNVIEDEIERMEDILGEMLTLSKPPKVKKKSLSLRSLLESIVQVIGPKAIMENIKVVQKDSFDGIPLIMGDEGRLKQLFLNLLKNGLESMQPGGRLTVYLQRCGENEVNVIIKDTGKGIKEHNLQQIFMPYFTTRQDGTGLGMPFVLQAVENHGGTISVSSEVEVGTSFILTFPVVKEVGITFKGALEKLDE